MKISHITLNDFTTSADTHDLTPVQKEKLLKMAQFFRDELASAYPNTPNE